MRPISCWRRLRRVLFGSGSVASRPARIVLLVLLAISGCSAP
ncbi:MAG: hypothetical protein QOF51_3984, partial [Chloroflexota bacterium]|nr:hypothetical protein [Chloroflexota bacterium]